MKARVISLNIDILSYSKAVELVFELAKNRISSFCCFANVHMTVEAFRNYENCKAINSATYIFSDGVPITIALRLLYGLKQERIAGMDFLPSLFSKCSSLGLRVFLFGGSATVQSNVLHKLRIEYPGLIIAGYYAPPFRELSETEEKSYVDEINRANPNIVLVSLGCPKQELWMARNSNKIEAPLLGVGGAFSVYAGMINRAPYWMQKYSLEWLFRLSQEPKRLLGRYLFTNSIFIFLLIKELFFSKINKKS